LRPSAPAVQQPVENRGGIRIRGFRSNGRRRYGFCPRPRGGPCDSRDRRRLHRPVFRQGSRPKSCLPLRALRFAGFMKFLRPAPFVCPALIRGEPCRCVLHCGNRPRQCRCGRGGVVRRRFRCRCRFCGLGMLNSGFRERRPVGFPRATAGGFSAGEPRTSPLKSCRTLPLAVLFSPVPVSDAR